MRARNEPSVATLASISILEKILGRENWRDEPFCIDVARNYLKALRNAPGVQDRVKALREAFVNI